MLDIRAIPAQEVPQHWEELCPFIEMALAESLGELIADDVLSRAKAGLLHLVRIAVDGHAIACLAVEFAEYPRKRALRVTLAGGSQLEIWFDAAEKYLIQGARNMGCQLLEMHGRPGWWKLLRRNKGVVRSIIMLREVPAEETAP